MIETFFSYASQDSPVVVRTKEDLERSGGVRCWCYETDSRRGVDFRTEFRAHALAAEVFVLFDSEHARHSKYVLDEVRTWQGRAQDCRLLVCRVQADGTWTEAELFPDQNFITYVDLVDYDAGIRKLCSELDDDHRPRFDTPDSRDFNSEIGTHLKDLPLEQRTKLVDQYELASRSTTRPDIAEAQLLVLIHEHLEDGPRGMLAPYLLLASLRVRAGKLASALETFDAVAERKPEDPRGWAGRANVLMSMGRHEEAAESHARCLACIDRSTMRVHADHAISTRYNMATALLCAGDVERAWAAVKELPPAVEGTAEVESLRARIQLRRGNAPGARRSASATLAALREGRLLEAGLDRDRLLELAECFRDLGQAEGQHEVLALAVQRYPHDPAILHALATLRCEQGDYEGSLESFRAARQHAGKDLRLLAEYAMLLHHLGHEREEQEVIATALDRHDSPPIEDYFTGLLHFLAARRDVAAHYYDRARRDPQCAQWSWYDEL